MEMKCKRAAVFSVTCCRHAQRSSWLDSANAHEPYQRVQEAVALGDLHSLLDRFAGRMDALNSMDPE